MNDDENNNDRDEDRNDDGADRGDRRGGGPPRNRAVSPDVAELIRFMAVNLVEKPDEVRVELIEERQANVFELEVAESDLGKVIGRGGKTARALRTVVQTCAPASRKRTLVEILE